MILLIFVVLLLTVCLLAAAFCFIRIMKSNQKELLGQMDAIKSERDALSEMIDSGTLFACLPDGERFVYYYSDLGDWENVGDFMVLMSFMYGQRKPFDER